MIVLDHLSKTYVGSAGAHEALRDINLHVESGDVFGIIGQSGAGKSTLVRCINLLERPTAGRVLIDGSDVTDYSGKQLIDLRQSIGMIFQNAGSSFCPIRTVGEQLLEEMKEHRKIKKAEFEDEAVEMLAKFGFQDPKRILKSYPFELSGGMQQRVGVAAAMLLKPKILLADEPTSALDVSIQKQVVEQMKMIREQYGTTILIVTHNIGVIRAMADSMLVLKDGKMEEYGKTQEVLSHPQSDYTKRLLAAIPVLRR